ncbi:MAG: hypothetical protein ACP5VP_09330 [Candidatus Limnocylindrales bacterium]
MATPGIWIVAAASLGLLYGWPGVLVPVSPDERRSRSSGLTDAPGGSRSVYSRSPAGRVLSRRVIEGVC